MYIFRMCTRCRSQIETTLLCHKEMEIPVFVFIFLLITASIGNVVSVDPIVTITDHLDGEEVIATKGRDISLTCEVQYLPGGRNVVWLRYLPHNITTYLTIDEGSDDDHYSVSKPRPNWWQITIKDIELDDEGVYACRVETRRNIYFTDQRYIRVFETPSIRYLMTSNNIKVTEGDQFRLECSSYGTRPSMSWRRVRGPAVYDDEDVFNGSTVTFHARPEHAGQYMCLAENPVGSDSTVVTVEVLYKPIMSVENAALEQAVDYGIEFVCEVNANPAPTERQVIWKRGDGSALSSRRHEFGYFINDNSIVQAKMYINHIQLSDYDTYLCEAENEIGRAEIQASLAQISDYRGPPIYLWPGIDPP